MSRHAQPRSSGGWLSLVLAVIAALGGASLASHVAAGPGRVAIGWATVLAAALFLIQYRSQRQSSLRLARIDHARRRDAIRLREEIAEAHHRSRLAVERSYAAVARSEALALEVNRLMAVMATAQAKVPAVQVLPAPPAPVQPAAPAPIVPAAPAARVAPAAATAPGTSLDLPLVTSPTGSSVPISPRREAPFAPPSTPAEPAPGAPTRTRVDLRLVESVRSHARGA